MQKSMFNYQWHISFTFNIGCIALYNVYNYWGDKLNLYIVKQGANWADSPRMGHICRGYDYWWEITDEILTFVTIDEYYDRYLSADVIKTANYLNDLAEKKCKCYVNKEEDNGD